MKVASVLLVLVLALSGCMTMRNVPRGATPKLKVDEALAVIGMDKRYRVHLQSGPITGNVWQMRFASPEANVFPEDGYIVVKLPVLPEQKRYSIPMVLPEGIGLGPQYVPCPGTMAPTFGLRSGVVNYVGDISYDLTGGKPSFKLSSDEEAAKKFLSTAYPGLASSRHISPMTPMQVAGTNCNPSFLIPIYVPR